MRLPFNTVTAILALICLVLGCESAADTDGVPPADESEWISLFNGTDLSGWDSYLGPRVEVDPADSSRQKIPGSAAGLNNDPEGVFAVSEVDGEPVIRISGVTGGGISTVDDYGDYHFRMEIKWGEGNPWLRTREDSGLLYHAGGEQGADQEYWMRSVEYQIMPDTYADLITIEGVVADVAVSEQDGRYYYDPNGNMLSFSRLREMADGGGRVYRLPTFEDPESDWITLELYAVGDQAVHLIDGEVVLVLHNIRLHENGETNPLTEGKIQIQSEGSEMFIRNIELRNITEFPAGLLDGHQVATAM